MNGNGDNYEARFTRIENVLETLVVSQRQLLTAQVLLTEQLEKTNHTVELVDKRLGERIDQLGERVDQIGKRVDQLGERMDQLAERMDQLSVRVEQVEGQVEALVKIVDGMIRNPGKQ